MATLRRTQPPIRQSRSVSGSKRPRSPEPPAESTSKRLKAATTHARDKEDPKDKALRQVEREKSRQNFKTQYTRYFPSFHFYFDESHITLEHLSAMKITQSRIRQLGGSVEDFFSNRVTHLITDQRDPLKKPDPSLSNKENDTPRHSSRHVLKRQIEDDDLDLINKAHAFELKIWDFAKLVSVVDRCLEDETKPEPSVSANQPSRALSRLLQSELINGTSERDPTQKRHDYKYFNRGTCFLLVEDINQQLAPIAIQEYVIPKGRDAATTKMPWPVLHCHPNARGPFIEFDEKEKRRFEKARRLELEQAEPEKKRGDEARLMKRRAEAHVHAKHGGCDLRRTVSMNNLHRRAKEQEMIDLDEDEEVDENASRINTREYIAASGNSVGITSTVVTTSTAGTSFKTSNVPAVLRGRPEVVTSLKFSGSKASAAVGNMGPPRIPVLKKSRSTNTMRLPKRDESSKPGYCESCREKFGDFSKHVVGRKHRKFAADDSNFLALDYVLARVKRRTLEDTERERQEWLSQGADESPEEMVDLDSEY